MQNIHDVILDTLMYYGDGNTKLKQCQKRAFIVDNVTVQCMHDWAISCLHSAQPAAFVCVLALKLVHFPLP